MKLSDQARNNLIYIDDIYYFLEELELKIKNKQTEHIIDEVHAMMADQMVKNEFSFWQLFRTIRNSIGNTLQQNIQGINSQ